jgi:hypothetical protein
MFTVPRIHATLNNVPLLFLVSAVVQFASRCLLVEQVVVVGLPLAPPPDSVGCEKTALPSEARPQCSQTLEWCHSQGFCTGTEQDKHLTKDAKQCWLYVYSYTCPHSTFHRSWPLTSRHYNYSKGHVITAKETRGYFPLQDIYWPIIQRKLL